MNDRIRAREVRLVSAEGEQVGIRALPDALTLARDLDLDLVEVAPQASPPVCRIMDYGKFKYEAAQKAKESRRKTNQISIKEMKYRVKIGKGDFETKTSKVTKFLEEGHKVKVTIMFRGREVHHPELGMRILDQVAVNNNQLAKVEASPKLDGRNMTMVLAPDKRVQAAAEAVRKKAAADQRQAERLLSSNGAAPGVEAPGIEAAVAVPIQDASEAPGPPALPGDLASSVPVDEAMSAPGGEAGRVTADEAGKVTAEAGRVTADEARRD